MIDNCCVKLFISTEIFEFVRFSDKGSEKTIVATSLAFTDKEKVTNAIIANGYDYNKIVSALLL